jgi:hypothetical protein
LDFSPRNGFGPASSLLFQPAVAHLLPPGPAQSARRVPLTDRWAHPVSEPGRLLPPAPDTPNAAARMAAPHASGHLLRTGPDASRPPPPFPSSSGARASPLPLLFSFKMVGIENPPPAAVFPPPTHHFLAPAYIKHSESTHSIPRSHSPTQIAPFATEKFLHRASPPPYAPHHREPLLAIKPAREALGEAPHHPLSLFPLSWRASTPFNGRACSLWRERRPPWPPVHGGPIDRSRRRSPRDHEPRSWIFILKNNSNFCYIVETYTEAPVLDANSDLVLGFKVYLISSPVYLQSSPRNFKTLYLFNRNSVLSDFCAKSFVVTKPIYQLHHIIDNHLFAILFDLFCVYCLFSACRSSSRERARGEFTRSRV